MLDSLRRCDIRYPFTIKTFGFGTDVCPKIMNEIAHMKEGQFFFVPDLTKIDECFVEALGGLVSVVGDNLKLSVKCSNQDQTKISKVSLLFIIPRLMVINGNMIRGIKFIVFINPIYYLE